MMSEAILGVVICIVIFSVAYFSVCLFEQRKFKENCQKMGDELRMLKRKLHELLSLRCAFDTNLEEPFVTRLMDIDKKVDSFQNDLKSHFQIYIQYREWFAKLEKSHWWQLRLRWDVITLYSLQRRCAEDIIKIQALDRELVQMSSRFDELKEFPWSIALQSRKIMEYLRQVNLQINELTSYGLYGEELTELVNRVREIEKDTKQIPVYFLSEPYDKLLAEVSQKDIGDVYKIVQKDMPNILAIMQQADFYKNQLLTLRSQRDLAEKEFERTVHLITHFLDGIDLSEERSKVEKWKEHLLVLEKRMDSLTVNQMTNLSKEFNDCIHEIQTRQQYLRQNRQKAYQHQRFMQSNVDYITQIQKRLDTIAQSNLIVNWDISGRRFHQMLDAYNDLQLIEKPYSFHLLENLYKESSHLQAALSEINRQTAQVAEVHRSCENMISSSEIKNLDQWIESAKKLAESIRPYDPRNWPNREWILNFDKQLEELERNYRNLTEKLTQKEVAESLIVDLYRMIKDVYRQSISFRERMNVIEQVFRNLVSSESRNLVLLKNTRNQFAQITMFVLSQPLLAEKVDKEIIQLDRKFDVCEAAFHQRDKDTVAKKQARLQQVISDVEQAANRWMSIVESDCLKLLNDLEKRINRIDQIGHFEDTLLYRAKEILAKRDEVFSFRRTARLSIPMDQLVGSMKMVFDTWQESYAVSKQLAEQVEEPLLSTYQEFQTLQNNVRAKYLELEKLIPYQRKWPPNSLLLTVERNEMLQVEERWQHIHVQPISVIHFVRTLSEMSGIYRSLLEKFTQYEQWAIQEQTRIERIEADIYRLDRLWEIQQRRYGQVAEIEGQIRDIRQKANKELTSLRQYWLTNTSRRPPSVDYDVVLRKLIELSRHLANAKIVVINEQGQQELMDINGQVILKT